jgi:pSer/pThr/pTyr-binding forkhead associated (FHA) protein
MPRIVLKEHDSDKTLDVLEVEATIGRDPACGFFIDGPNSKVVSGRHARIFFLDNAWWIEDTSRNGTILDDERLQQGQRHAVKVGQVIGLGESGPRYRVMALESRKVADTVMELPDLDAPAVPSTTAPRHGAPPPASHRPPPLPPANISEVRTAAIRHSEAMRAGLNIEEPTEPMSPSPDWLVHVVLRSTNTNERYDVRAQVVRLGRSPDCNVQVPPEQGASVSRVHTEIAIQDGGVTVRDAGSRNGTFINGARLEAPHPAAKNDLIMLGSGGPTFSIEDLHIVKGNAPPISSVGSDDTTAPSGVASAQAAVKSPLSRHTSYRSEPPTAPSKLTHGVSGGSGGSGGSGNPARIGDVLSKNVLEDVPEDSARRVRILIWASVGTILLIGAFLLGRSR